MAKKDRAAEESTEESQEIAKVETEGAMVAATPATDRLVVAINALPLEKRTGIQNLVETLNPQQEGFGEMDEVNYRPPVIKVKQPVTTAAPKAAANGDLYSADTGEVFTRPMAFVPVYPYENRARFQPGAMKPDCRSEDCKTSIYGNPCSDCPDRPWKDNKQQKCNNSVNVMATTPDFSKLYHLQFSKTSTKAGTSIVRQTRNALQKPWQRLYHLDTDEVKGGQGVYYVLTTSFVEGSDPDFHETGRALHDIMGEQRFKAKEVMSERISQGQQAVDNLDDDVGAPDDGETAKGDFTDL